MLENCSQCGAILCECQSVKPNTSSREISDIRAAEIQSLINDFKSGKLSEDETKRLFSELKEKTRGEILLMKELYALLYPLKASSFDDFPLP